MSKTYHSKDKRKKERLRRKERQTKRHVQLPIPKKDKDNEVK